MTELLVAVLVLLAVGYLVAWRTTPESRNIEATRDEPERQTKQKPDLSKVPTLPPIRRKHPPGREDRDPGTHRAS